MDSQISLRASTYNARERSAHRNGLKLCESSKQAKHHGCQIPPLLPPLPALHTPHVVPLRHSLRTTNRTLLTRVLVIEKTSRNRARVTHEVNNPQTRIPVNSSSNRYHETIRVHLTVPPLTTPRHTRAQLTWWPLRNRLSRIALARNRIRQSFLSVANPATTRRSAHLMENRCDVATRVVASNISVVTLSRSYQQHAQPADSKPESTGAV